MPLVSLSKLTVQKTKAKPIDCRVINEGRRGVGPSRIQSPNKDERAAVEAARRRRTNPNKGPGILLYPSRPAQGFTSGRS